MGRLYLFVPIILLLLGFVLFLLSLGREPERVSSALIGREVISFSGVDLYDSGRIYDKSIFVGGDVSLVNIFASWCVPCRAEKPFIAAIGDISGVQMVGLNWKDSIVAARDFLAEGVQGGDGEEVYDIVVFDGDGAIGLDWGVSGVPETYLVDGGGIIRFKHVGPILGDDAVAAMVAKIVELRSE